MKKIILFFFLLVVFASCSQSKIDVDAAKKKILEKNKTPVEVQNKIETPQEEIKQDREEKKKVQIISLTPEQFLSFDAIDEKNLSVSEVKILGKTTDSVDKITVLFSNPTSRYPDDDYTLQTFKPGGKTFRYIASSRNQVLDYGENTYIFTAYSGENISQTKIVLFIEDPRKQTGEKWIESQLIGPEWNTVLVNLPTSSQYGEPMKLGEASFTYTQIKGLEIQKEILPQVSCETLTDFLTERISSWYYWNTCRDIVKGKGIKFNVIRLLWEKYVYERHYMDFVNGFYGTYELETGEGVTSKNIAEKNNALKEQDFPSLEVVDELMKDIVNSK